MSLQSFEGKVALVTGGSKGIGKATALGLARAGATVVINYASDSAVADTLVQEIGAERAYAIKGDAADIATTEAMIDEIVTRYGKLDILVLAAAVAPMKELANTTPEDFERAFAVNVKGPYFMAQKAAPHMPSGSHIIFFSTSLTKNSSITPNYLLYVSTKGAIEQMTRIIAKDLGRNGIVVNAVAPGPTGTELLGRIASGSPLNRIGTPEEVADVIVFMCGAGSRWVGGQVLMANGAYIC